MHRLAVLSTLLLGACATQPLPFFIERGGTLPLDRYPALERLAAAAAPVVKARQGTPLTDQPEPYWVYVVDPGLDLARLPLQLGSFTGESGKTGEVAAALPGKLADELGRAHLFASVGTVPVPGTLVLSGTVTRATTEVADGSNSVAMTQVEARLTRNGAVVGVMQVNAVQLDSNPFIPLVAAVYSAIQGSRAGYISTKVHEMFEGIAAGRVEGIDTDTFSKRFIRAPIPDPFSE